MKGILIASHGDFAKGMYDTTKMFFSDQKQYSYICMDGSSEIDIFLEDMKKKIDELNTGEGVIVLCDLLYGTPCNTVARILNDSIDLILGVNLPLVLELLGARLCGDIDLESIIATGRTGVCNFKSMIQGK